MMHASSPEVGAPCLSGHSQLVSDLRWADSRSQRIISGSYDHTVMLWDVETSAQVETWTASGIVLCVAVFGEEDSTSFLCGTNKGAIHMLDVRNSGGEAIVWNNPGGAAVNAIHVIRDDMYMITGDSAGIIRTWDVRKSSECVEHLTQQNEDAGEAYFVHNSIAP